MMAENVDVEPTPHRLFSVESPESSTALCSNPLPSVGADAVGGVGLVLGQDVSIQTDGKIYSPIIVEALVPGQSMLAQIHLKNFSGFD